MGTNLGLQVFSSLLSALLTYGGLSGCWGCVEGNRVRFWVLFTGSSWHQLIQENVLGYLPALHQKHQLDGLCFFVTTWLQLGALFCQFSVWALQVFQRARWLVFLLKGKHGKQCSAPASTQGLSALSRRMFFKPLGFDTATYALNI